MKRRLLFVLLAVCMVVTLMPTTTAQAALVTTVPAGYTGIYTAADLDAVRNNLSGNYILMNDIDLSSWGDWAPIGEYQYYDSDSKLAFSGVLDGNGHSIFNINITDKSDNHGIGLFSKAYGATIKNLYISGNITCSKESLYIGAFVGHATNDSLITNCTSNVTIDYHCGDPLQNGGSYTTGNSVYIGGIVGAFRNRVEINECANYGTITCVGEKSWADLGGIIGGSNSFARNTPTITNCYNAGSLSVSTSCYRAYVGGIYGYLSQYGNISKCYNVGALSLSTPSHDDGYWTGLGGIGGGRAKSAVTMSDSYYLANVSRVIGLDEGMEPGENFQAKSCSASGMQQQSTFAGFDFNSIWVMGDGSYPYPRLRANGDTSSSQPISAPTLKLLTTEDIHSGDEFEIYWNDVSGAESYKIEVLNSNGNIAYIDNVSYGNIAYKLSHLTEGTYQIYVTAIFGTESAKSNAISVQILVPAKDFCKTHTFTSAGGDYCTVCGYKFEPTIKPMNSTFYAVKDNVPVRDNYYAQNSKTVRNIQKDLAVAVTGSLVNAVGRTWYVLADGTYVYSEDVTSTRPSMTMYTVKFDVNGGINAPSDARGIHITVPTTTIPTRTGYTFLGYSESKNATTANYVPGQKFVATKDMTLYAVWAESKYDTNIAAIISAIRNGTSTISTLGDSGARYWTWYYNKSSTRTDSWCAVYASYLVAHSGVNGLKSASPSTLLSTLKENGCYIDANANPEYTPKTGDFIFLDYQDDGIPDHIGIIVVVNGAVQILHGNWSQAVKLSALSGSTGTSGGRIDQCILGYGDVSRYAASH